MSPVTETERRLALARRNAEIFLSQPGVAAIILVGSTQAQRNPAEDTRVSAFNALFGGNFTSRVNMNLREEKGWSYGARSSLSGGRGPRSFIVQAPVQTDATKGALIELRKELTGVVGAKPPTAAELNTVRTNTLLGMASRWETSGAVINSLVDIDQFNLPADYWADMPHVGAEDVTRLEGWIDELNEEVGPLKEFILPGGGPVGAFFHQARTVCRRAERQLVRLMQEEPEVAAGPMRYLNRLSDWLFVAGRWAAKALGEPEYLWDRPKKKAAAT